MLRDVGWLNYYAEGVADGVAGEKTEGGDGEAEADHFEKTAFEGKITGDCNVVVEKGYDNDGC